METLLKSIYHESSTCYHDQYCSRAGFTCTLYFNVHDCLSFTLSYQFPLNCLHVQKFRLQFDFHTCMQSKLLIPAHIILFFFLHRESPIQWKNLRINVRRIFFLKFFYSMKFIIENVLSKLPRPAMLMAANMVEVLRMKLNLDTGYSLGEIRNSNIKGLNN